MWSILALGAVERLIHHVIDLDAITRIQLNQLQGKMLRVVLDSPQLSVDVFFDQDKFALNRLSQVRRSVRPFLNNARLIRNKLRQQQQQPCRLKMWWNC